MRKNINFTKTGYNETFNASIEKFFYVKSVWKNLYNNTIKNLNKIVSKIPYVKDYKKYLSYITIPTFEIGRFAKMQEVDIDYRTTSNRSINSDQYPKNARGENLKDKTK